MQDNPTETTPRGWRRALYQWLTGPDPSARPEPDPGDAPGQTLPLRIGHYTIDRKLGEGGMGVVYAARDERLQRSVAVKTISSVAESDTARKRFWREARAAASVNHPNICQIYEIGEDAGELFIAMELLEGRSLSEHLQQGAINASETVSIGLGMLAALSGAPVLPVYVQGSGRALPKGAVLPRPARVTVAFGEPLRFAKTRGRTRYQDASDEIMAAIGRLKMEAERGRPATADTRTDPTTPGPAPAGRIH